jgi:hypothetical protein
MPAHGAIFPDDQEQSRRHALFFPIRYIVPKLLCMRPPGGKTFVSFSCIPVIPLIETALVHVQFFQRVRDRQFPVFHQPNDFHLLSSYLPHDSSWNSFCKPFNVFLTLGSLTEAQPPEPSVGRSPFSALPPHYSSPHVRYPPASASSPLPETPHSTCNTHSN